MVKNMPYFEANKLGFQEPQRMAPFLWKEDINKKLKCVHQHYISLSSFLLTSTKSINNFVLFPTFIHVHTILMALNVSHNIL
jgi:hypothetical protein